MTQDWQYIAGYVTQKDLKNTSCLQSHHFWEREENESKTAAAPTRSVLFSLAPQQSEESGVFLMNATTSVKDQKYRNLAGNK